MRILYVWARENGLLHNQGINLDSGYEFHYEENLDQSNIMGTLTVYSVEKNKGMSYICNSL